MSCSFRLSLILYTASLVIFFSNAQADQVKQRPYNNLISTIFVFGDSTVDPGNNNYIAGTVTKSNFPPYGRDFINHIPTGRFSNGRLVTDFIASYLDVKETIPPYLDPTLSIDDLMTGVSFASAGSGFDPLTAILSGVISVQKQVEYFGEYKERIEHSIGKEKTKNLINKALFIVSAGTNDLVVNYFGAGAPVRRKTYPTVSSYNKLLMQIIDKFIQDLSKEGARKMMVFGLPPLGCLPEVITLNITDAFHQRNCIETFSSVARNHNNLLRNTLIPMQSSHMIKTEYADIYKPVSDMVQSPTKYGFDHVNIGCCGTGYFETAILCNPKSTVCYDPSKYLYWDAVHSTERAYRFIFDSLRPVINLM